MRSPVAALWLLPALALGAQDITAPHLEHTPAAVSVTLNGQTFINQGLVGAGQLPAGTVDFLGDTLGSFSSLQVRSWRRVGGHYEGVLWTLPDRGRNDPAAGLFYDYSARLHRLRIRYTPQDGHLSIVPDGGLRLRDFRGQPFTGADPGQGSLVQRGLDLPSPASGPGAGKVSLDAEALQFARDGGFYVGDEYAANVYRFDARGRLQGVLQPPAAITPRRDGHADFSSLAPPQTGRRNNQGVEGLSLSPDGSVLFVMLQSALMQDSASGNASGRINTRVLVYDLRHGSLPAAPVEHYVVQLPAWRRSGDGGAPDRTAAQSEIRALDNHRFLMLSRDSAGLGAADEGPVVYKSILLVDTRDATNLAGSEYETGVQPVLQQPDASTLRPQIRAAQWVEFINLLNPVQLARFGLGIGTLSEKWEAMDLVPALDPKAPDDYFLFVGNDNDFIARHCRMSGQSCDSAFDNDNRVLIYRVTLPHRAAGL
ncbi:MAG: esterase-like activity of phytase family protein [Steroidobacteraceae bacterium]